MRIPCEHFCTCPSVVSSSKQLWRTADGCQDDHACRTIKLGVTKQKDASGVESDAIYRISMVLVPFPLFIGELQITL